MVLSCRQAQKVLSLYYDGCLPPAKANAVEEHLKACPACRAEMAGWAKLAAALAEMPVPAAPAGFAARVMGRLPTAPRRRFLAFRKEAVLPSAWRPRLVGLAAVAAAFLFVYASWNLAAQYQPPPPAPSVAERAGSESVRQWPGGAVEPAGGQERRQPPTDKAEAGGSAEQERGRSAVPAQAPPGSGTSVGGEPGRTSSASVPPKASAPRAAEPYLLAQKETPAPAPYEPRAFLNRERLITSSFLRLQVDDLEQAAAAARSFGRELGAKVEELARGRTGGRAQMGLKFTVDTGEANTLLLRLTGLGKVLNRTGETRDVTADFAAALELYHYWIGVRGALTNPEDLKAVDREIARLEAQLMAWDEEASKQVVVLWLEEAE